MNPLRILLCCAVKEEAAFMNPLAHQVLITGMGPENARQSVSEALSLPATKPDLILSCGFAGGLNPELPPSSVLFQLAPHAPVALHQSLSEAGARPARFHTANRVLTTIDEKKRLWESTRADAVEMESGPIMKLCSDHDIPGAIIRVISDTARENLPLDFNRLMTSQQKLSMARLLCAVLASPRAIPSLMRLNRRTREAARQLAQVISMFHQVVGSPESESE